MAHRWFDNKKYRFKNLLQVSSKESTSVYSPTPSPNPSRPPSRATTRPTSRPASYPPTSTDSNASSLPSLQERLWNEAYDALKASELKLVEQYEKILSAKLHENDPAFVPRESTSNEIGENSRTRCGQMRQLVQEGLDRTQKQASIKRGIDEGLQVVQEVRRIADRAVSAAPEAAVAWVGVCLGLEILSNPVTEARENREGIAYVLSRMEWYWTLASLLLDENKAEESSVALQAQLTKQVIELYEKLLSYQIQSVCLYHRNWAAVIGRDMIKLDDWAGQLSGIQKAEAAVQEDIKHYNTEEIKMRLQKLAETSSAMEIKLKDIHSAITDQTRQQDQWRQDDKYEQCMRDLRETDPSSDKKRIEDAKGGLLRDSYRWILDHEDFRRWRDDPQSQLLWIRGDPGKGKTMLLCGIIDELGMDPDRHLSYFFCQATEGRLSNATAVLRGLIYLLVESERSLISHVREKYDHAGKQLFEDGNAWEALSKILAAMLDDPVLDGAFLVVDALDECNTSRERLLDFITRPSRVRWIVSSRNWEDIKEKLCRTKQVSLELNQDSISKAVDIYTRFKVEKLATLKGYDQDTRDAVEGHLASNANGTFLWVALVCQELLSTDAWDVQDVIKDIPAGLDALYGRMMQYIQNLERRNPEMCRQILSTVVVACRPLRLEELGLLSGLLSSIQKSTSHTSKITGMCGSFLTIRDNVVYIIHQSAQDFLSQSPFLFPSGTEHKHRALFSSSIGALSETLRRDMYNLSMPGFPIDQVSPPDPDPLASIRYSCVFWVDHLLASKHWVKMNDEASQDVIAVYEFLQNKYLYWLESLSLLHSISQGVIAVKMLEALAETPQLIKILRDAYRFILSHGRGIEIAPLQVYASALVFSPTRSLVREVFRGEEPNWITLKPSMDSDWNACLQTLEGHGNRLTSVMFSPDGQRLASSSYDKTVRIWDAATGTCVQTLEGHGNAVRSVMFSPDGQRLASGSHDKTVKIWDTATGVYIQTLKDHGGSVTSVVFSPDEQRLASGSHDKTVKIWDGATGACLYTLKDHGDAVTFVVFSPDGQRLASSSYDKTVRIWDAATGTCVQTLEGHGDWVMSVMFSPDGQRLASGSHDKTVKIWDTATGVCMQTLKNHGHSVKYVVFSPDGQRLASGSYDNTVRIWDVATGACLYTLKDHGDAVTSVVFSPDGQPLASGPYDKTVEIWDAATGVCVQTVDIGRSLHFLSFNSATNSLATEVGLLNLDYLALTPVVDDQLINTTLEGLSRCGWGISADGIWIIQDMKQMLWLPPDYRPGKSAVVGSTIAIGSLSGRILVMKFS